MRKPAGFTLIELLTVIFMIGFVSALAVPGIMSWRSAAKLRGAAENLKGDLELAKLKAIQVNGPVAIQFMENRYMLFVDTGANDGELDPDEEFIKNVVLPPGIKFDSPKTTFAAVTNESDWPKKSRFKGRGTADAGTAVLTNSKQDKAKSLKVSSLGRITLANYPLN